MQPASLKAAGRLGSALLSLKLLSKYLKSVFQSSSERITHPRPKCTSSTNTQWSIVLCPRTAQIQEWQLSQFIMTRSRPLPRGANASKLTLSVNPEAGPTAKVGVSVGCARYAGERLGLTASQDTTNIPAASAKIKKRGVRCTNARSVKANR